MSHEIEQRIDYYIQREQDLLNELLNLRKQSRNISLELVEDFVAEGVKLVAKDVLRLPFGGKYVKKLTKTLLHQKQIDQFKIQEQSIEAQHQSIVQDARTLLQSVSIQKANLREPNSYMLIKKIDEAQECIKLETKIRRTISALRSIVNKPLIYNKDIPLLLKPIEPKKTLRFPRLATLRNEIPDLEPLLRKFIRRKLAIEFGENWINKIREKFSSNFPKWEKRAINRRGKDILDGMQFGDLLNIINSFPQLRKHFPDAQQANLALTVIQAERPFLIHPLEEEFKEDISEEKFNKINLAIQTLRDLLKDEI